MQVRSVEAINRFKEAAHVFRFSNCREQEKDWSGRWIRGGECGKFSNGDGGMRNLNAGAWA